MVRNGTQFVQISLQVSSPPGACDHRAVVLSWSHLARRWVALKRRSAWLVVDTQVKACSWETHSPSRASKTYGHNAFQIMHIHTTVINSGLAHTTQHRTHCGLWLRLQSWLMPQSPHRRRNDLKCVEWVVYPCSIQSNPLQVSTDFLGNIWGTICCNTCVSNNCQVKVVNVW